MESERRYLQSAKLGANLAVSGAIAFYHHCEGRALGAIFAMMKLRQLCPLPSLRGVFFRFCNSPLTIIARLCKKPKRALQQQLIYAVNPPSTVIARATPEAIHLTVNLLEYAESLKVSNDSAEPTKDSNILDCHEFNKLNSRNDDIGAIPRKIQQNLAMIF